MWSSHSGTNKLYGAKVNSKQKASVPASEENGLGLQSKGYLPFQDLREIVEMRIVFNICPEDVIIIL